MKHIFLVFIFTCTLFAGVIKTPIISIDEEKETVTIDIHNINLGITGFLVHRVSSHNSTILRSLTVVEFDKEMGVATLQMDDFYELRQNSLPKGKWEPELGDIAILAFAYSRAVLIAPTEEIYYRITSASSQVQWVHPDIFATILSFSGHPTPLKEDFYKLSIGAATGLIFFYLDEKLYTVDAKSLKVINISVAPLLQEEAELPFHSRVEEIEANWFGEGSDELESYEPYYFELLIEYNPNNAQLLEFYNDFKSEQDND